MLEQDQQISVLGITIWVIGAIFFLYEFFLRTFVGTLAHQIIPDLHLTAEKFALIGSAYYVAYGFMQVPVGLITDRFGVKSSMLFATLCCALATFLFSRSTGFESAFLSRLLMGFGSSFAFICLLVMVSTWFPSRLFGFFAGNSQFIGTLGPVIAGGPLVTILAATHESWRVAMMNVGSFGIVLAILTLVFVRNKPRGGTQKMLFLNKTVPLKLRLKRLFQNPQAWTIALYSACVYSPLAVMAAVWGPDYLETRGLTQSQAAYMISIAWIAYAVGCSLFGALSDLCRRRKPFFMLCGLLGVLCTLLIIYLPMSTWAYAGCFVGFGLAASGQNIGFAAIGEHTAPESKATAMGLNNGLMVVTSALCPLIISTFVERSAHGDMSHLVPKDFAIGLAILPLLYLGSLALSLVFFKETFGKPQKSVLILKKQVS